MTHHIAMEAPGPDGSRCTTWLEVPDSPTADQVSDHLLQALEQLQDRLGLPSTLAEVAALRGTCGAIASLLDELGVPSTPHDGLLGVATRTELLAAEVRESRLRVDGVAAVTPDYQQIVRTLERQRDDRGDKIRAHGEVINGVRRALGVTPETRDEELAEVVGELVFKEDASTRSLRRTVETTREVRAALKVAPDVLDHQLGRAVALQRETLELVDRELTAEGFGPIAGADLGTSVAMRLGMRGAASRRALYTPETLARSFYEVSRDGSFGPALVSWDELGDATKARLVMNAQMALHRSDAARPDRDVVAPQQLAHMLFMSAQEVSERRGSEPIPLSGGALWEEALWGRRSWWLEVAERTLANMDGALSVPTGVLPVTPGELAHALHVVQIDEAFEQGHIQVVTADGVNTPEIVEKAKAEYLHWDPASKDHQLRLVETARRVLDSLPSIAAPKNALPPVTPEQLARAIHLGVMMLPNPDGDVVNESFEDAPPQWNEWRLKVSEIVLSELPQIARSDAEAGGQFAVHMDASLAEAARTIAGLREENRQAVQAGNEFAAERNAAREECDRLKAAEFELFEALASVAHMLGLAPAGWPRAVLIKRVLSAVRALHGPVVGSLREIATALGMSFGGSENVSAIGGMTVDAVKQLVAEHGRNARELASVCRELEEMTIAGNDANSEMLFYRDMMMFVADQLGLPADVVDDAKRFGHAVRAELGSQHEARHRLARVLEETRGVSGVSPSGVLLTDAAQAITRLLELWSQEKARPVVSMCVPAPEDWEIDLVPVGPDGKLIEEVYATSLRPGARLALEDGAFALKLHYVGPLLSWGDLTRVGRKPVLGSITTDKLDVANLISAVSGGAVPSASDHAALQDQLKRLGEVLRAEQGRARNAVASMQRQLAEALGAEVPPEDDGEDADRWADMIMKVGDLVADREDLQELAAALGTWPSTSVRTMTESAKRLADYRTRNEEVSAQLDGEQREFRRKLAVAMGRAVLGDSGLIESARVLAEFERAHRVCRGAEALERELAGQLAEVLGRPYADESFRMLLSRVTDVLRERADQVTDLASALGLRGTLQWSEMISRVAGSTDAHERMSWAVNALSAIREDLGLPPKVFPAVVVGAVRDLKASRAVAEGQLLRLFDACGVQHETWAKTDVGAAADRALDEIKALVSFRDAVSVPGGAQEVRRVQDAVMTVLEAAGIDLAEDFTRPDVTVQKAGDAAAILRSWPDVLRAVSEFDGDEVEQPDEVAPMLMNFVPLFRRADECVGQLDRYAEAINSLEALLAMVTGQPLRPDVASVRDRFGLLIDEIFAPVLEAGSIYGVEFEAQGSKQGYARLVLMQIRNHVAMLPPAVPEQVLRGLSAFDIGEPTDLAEVESLLKKYAKTYHMAGRYQAVLHHIEVALSEWTGNPKTFNDATLKQRLTDLVTDLDRGKSSMWASFTEQIAARLESTATMRADVEDDDRFVQGFEYPEMLHKATLSHAAIWVRAHAAALVSGEQTHPLVMALQSGTFWAPDAGSSELELSPDGEGDVVLRNEGCGGGSILLGASELAPVGAALMALSYYHVRENGLRAQRKAREDAAVAEAREIAAGAEEVKAVGPIRVTPRMPQEWSYGPNAIDPDPGKRWHIGCGGEVQTFDGVDLCGDCRYEWPSVQGDESPKDGPA